MLKAGQTVLLPKPGAETKHLWVVLTAPDSKGIVAMVNLTTQRAHSDPTTILRPGDHSFIKHPTTVFYADSRLTLASAVETAIRSGYYPSHDDCSPEVLDRLLAGALTSIFTPENVKRHLRKT